MSRVGKKPIEIPAGVTVIAAAACIVGANSVNIKRNAALATAYSLSETALKEYQSKVVSSSVSFSLTFCSWLINWKSAMRAMVCFITNW